MVSEKRYRALINNPHSHSVQQNTHTGAADAAEKKKQRKSKRRKRTRLTRPMQPMWRPRPQRQSKKSHRPRAPSRHHPSQRTTRKRRLHTPQLPRKMVLHQLRRPPRRNKSQSQDRTLRPLTNLILGRTPIHAHQHLHRHQNTREGRQTHRLKAPPRGTPLSA